MTEFMGGQVEIQPRRRDCLRSAPAKRCARPSSGPCNKWMARDRSRLGGKSFTNESAPQGRVVLPWLKRWLRSVIPSPPRPLTTLAALTPVPYVHVNRLRYF
jgi:hypothetical protein